MKLIIFALLIAQNLLALVSISPVEIGNKAGLSFKIEAGFETKRGNTDKDNYQASARVIYDEAKEYVVWAELSGEYGESNAVADTNKAFGHLRFIHSLSDNDNLRYEMFSQLESDEFRLINSRLLGGIGLRYRLLNSEERGKGFFGLSIFHENIEYIESSLNPKEENQRLNVYLSYSIKLDKSAAFSYVLYYQPKVDDFSDYIVTNDLELKVKLYKTLDLKLSVTYSIDSMPPIGVQKSDFTQRTTLVLSF